MKPQEFLTRSLFVVIVIPSLVMYNGLLFMCLWDWFVVYAFGVQSLTFIQALGLYVFVRTLKPTTSKEEKTWDSFVSNCIATAGKISVAFGIAYLITLFQ